MTRPYAPGYRIPTDLLLKAYASGVFPMAESATDPEVFWVRPETRGIIPLYGFHAPKSLKKTIRKNPFDIRFDFDFEATIAGCAERREERRSTWINAPILEAYVQLHRLGHCHSVEAWREVLRELSDADIANMTPVQALVLLNEMQVRIKENNL